MPDNVTNLIVSLAAVVTAGVAIVGLTMWRKEFLGRRKIELAEEVLALFYEARDVFAQARSDLVLPGEGVRPAVDGETPEQKAARNYSYVVIERLAKHDKLFARVRTLRYRFVVLLGKDSATPLQELLHVRGELVAQYKREVRLLTHRFRTKDMTREEKEILDRQLGEAAAVLQADDPVKGDSIAKKVDALVERIEATCKPLIEKNTSGARVLRWFTRELGKQQQRTEDVEVGT